jgi:hypothetical protein
VRPPFRAAAPPPGPQGEVTTSQLTSAIGSTSSNSNLVLDLSALTISDPPTQAQMELMRNKINELISALRR